MSRSNTPSNFPTPVNSLGQRAQSHSDTQRSLHEASAALDTVFDSIHQVRNSLLQLSESWTSGDVPTASPATNGANNVNQTQNQNQNRDGIGPGHDALLLAGDTGTANNEAHWQMRMLDNQGFVRPGSLEASMTPQTMPRPLTSFLPPLYAIVEPPVLVQPPPLPSVVPPRFSRQINIGTPTSVPNPIPISSATAHGLRVAAREANNSNAHTYAHRGVQQDFLPPAVGVSYGMTTTTAVPAPSQPALVPFPGSRPIGTREPHPLRPNPMPSFTPTLPPLPPFASYPSHPMYPPNNPQNFFIPTSDLYHRHGGHLVQIPIQMSRPVSSQLSRTRVIPTTRAVSGGSMGMENFPAMPGGTGPGGPEPDGPAAGQSHEGELDWTSDNFISWLFPAGDYTPSLVPRQDPQNPGTLRITRSTDSPLPPPPPPHSERPPRRRGWARLDLDGNEIPWDEEEELERSRTEYRVQALQRVRQDPNPNNSQNSSNGPPETNRRNGRMMFPGSVLDSMISVPVMPSRSQQQQHQHYHQQQQDESWTPPSMNQNFPLYIDPLPMPLSSMMKVDARDDRCYPDVIVPKHACLAGR